MTLDKRLAVDCSLLLDSINPNFVEYDCNPGP